MKKQALSLTNKVAFLVTAILFFGSAALFLPPTHANSSTIAIRDATRISDLTQMQNDMQLYYNKCGYYPGIAEPGGSCGVYLPVFTWADLTAALTGSNLGITNVPNDPSVGARYIYGAGPGSKGYVLGARLEDPANPAFAQSVSGFAYGVMCKNTTYCVKL
jgi:hypothetical protein